MTKVSIIYSVYGSRLESQCYPGTSWYQILVIDLIGQLSHNDIGMLLGMKNQLNVSLEHYIYIKKDYYV